MSFSNSFARALAPVAMVAATPRPRRLRRRAS